MDDGETTNDSRDGLIDDLNEERKRKKPKPPNIRRIRRIKRTADQVETTADE